MKDAKKLIVFVGVVGAVICASAFAQEGFCPTDLTAPVKGTIGYTLISDYMFRGLNISDIVGGHVGRGAHELSYGLSLDLAEVGLEDVGVVGVTAKQAYLGAYAGTNANLAKTDIAVSLTRPCPLLDGVFTFEWRNYNWSNLPFAGGHGRTQELTAKLALKDGKLIEALTGEDMGESVLNPTIQYIIDYDMADGGQVLLIGLSHAFDMAEYMPELAGVTLTPSWTVAIDNRYYGSYIKNLANRALVTEDTTKFAYMEYGVSAGADLTEMVGLTCGKLGINGGIGFVQALENLAKGVLHDTLYSYVSLVYSW